MSDLTANDSSSFGGMGLQNITRPKFQPIRVKALLHFGESDDDDDDESENKLHDSNDESNSDKWQSLPSNSTKDMLQKLSSISKEGFNFSEDVNIENNKNRSLRAAHVSPEGSREVVIDIFPTRTRINCADDKGECKVSDVDSNSCLIIEEPNRLEIHSCKPEEKTQEYYSSTITLKSHQTDAIHEGSMAILSSSSLSVYKGDYNTKTDANRSLQPMSNAEARQENAYMPDILSRRKGDVYNISAENKGLLAKSNENYLSNLNKEDQRHKNSQNFIEQVSKDRNKDREEEYHCRNSNVRSEFDNCIPQTTSGNSTHPTAKYSSQYSIAMREANEKHTSVENTQFNTPLLNETGKSLPMINRLVTETPLKHLQAGPAHPNPCASHKQLFYTPQGKPSADVSKSHVQTPSTILSTWCHNTMRQTPMDQKNLIKDYRQTPRNTVCTPIMEQQESSGYHGTDTKSTRRPLVNTMLAYGDFSAYPSQSKSLPLSTHSGSKCITPELQQEDRNRKTAGLSEMKLIQTKTNYDNDFKSVMHSIEEMKENEQPNPSMVNTLLENNRKIMHDKEESKTIGSNVGFKGIQDSMQKRKDEDIVLNTEERKDSRDRYSIRKGREELRQIVNKVVNVQFSVPSSIPPQWQSKTLFVKDREYLILGSLGRGMSGEVLRVQDMSCGELRAIKCVDLSKMDKDSAQGCLDEISLLYKLQASCVIKMFDYHIKEPMVYVVMEMGDTDLSRFLKSMSQEKQLPLTMILYYWTEMLTAVKHIHDNGVIHSDLKPANFLLVRGRLKLIDFGIASNINADMTSVLKNNPIGTLNYISPEALMDIGGNANSPNHNVKYKISFKSDVWSLGCILYSLVYGHTPFHHIRSQWAKVNAITNPKPDISFPTTFSNEEFRGRECTPPVLIDVMRKCLQHDPKARPTVSQLLQVQYVPTKQDIALISAPNIPANVLIKIKHALNEEEWRQLVEVLDTRRHNT